MSDLINSLWEPLDDANIHPSPDGIAKESPPNEVPEVIRAMKGALKRDFQQKNALILSTGTGNAYVLTYDQAPEGYAKGLHYRFFADKTNTGAATLNINGLGTKTILRRDGTVLLAGDIGIGQLLEVKYDGSAFRVISGAGAKFTGNVTAATFTGDGAALINLNATELKSGTVHNDRLAGDYNFGSLALAGTLGVQGINNHNNSHGYRVYNDGTLNGAFYVDTSTGNPVFRKYNLTTGAGEGYIRIDGNGVNDAKYNGQTIWHAGNDGAGTGLDADLIDGYHASDLYRDNAHFTTTGDLTISNGSPSLILTDTSAGSYNTKIVVDANNWYLQKQADGATTWTTFMQFEMDTTNAYANGSQIITDARLTAALINGKLGYTPANNARSIVAGNGLSGGGAITADRTITLGTPGTITATSTNSVSSTSHTHDFDIGSFMYTGSSISNTNFPVGSYLQVYTDGLGTNRNANIVPTVASGDNFFFRQSGRSGAGTAIPGTWRSRGMGADTDWCYCQRIS